MNNNCYLENVKNILFATLLLICELLKEYSKKIMETTHLNNFDVNMITNIINDIVLFMYH